MPAASPTVERNGLATGGGFEDDDGSLPPSVEINGVAGARGTIARVPTVDGVLILRKLNPAESREADGNRTWSGKVDLRPYIEVLRAAPGGEWVDLDVKEAGVTALALKKRVYLSAKQLGLNLHWAGKQNGRRADSNCRFKLV
jgi:hypothetical protein